MIDRLALRRGDGRVRPAALVAIALGVLLLGTMVYVSDRAPSSAALVPRFVRVNSAPWFGVVGQWLPSLAHAFSFSLLSAAALPRRFTPMCLACATWGLVDTAFELGQHPALRDAAAHASESLLGHGRIGSGVAAYFIRGTFDPGDLVAAALGAAAAAGLMMAMHWVEADHDV